MNGNEQFAKFGKRASFYRIKRVRVLQIELVDQVRLRTVRWAPQSSFCPRS